MIKKTLFILILAVAAVCVAATFQSDDMRVTRTAIIDAPPEAVYKVVNDFRQWEAWSPWAKLDPAMKTGLEGPPEGVGAMYTWSGNMEVGEGRTTLVESIPSKKVAMKLDFVRPMEGTSDVQFTFSPEAAGTKVTWDMQSKKPFVGKVMSLFMDCEKMCADQFDTGLANLKKHIERGPKA